jgi:23S rRNA (adenine2030-N6)-methyltransferase
MALVQKYNLQGKLLSYPGSACLARDLLRPADKLVLAELHPGECAELEKSLKGARNTTIFKRDGFTVMDDKMPPPDRRGLVIIDPPYEVKTDYSRVPKQVEKIWKKWRQGVFFIWYPILKGQPHLELLTALRRTDITDILISEIRLNETPKEGFAMYGTGVAIVNPPMTEPAVAEVTQFIAARLPYKAAGETYWLANKMIEPETGMIAV